MFLGSIEHVYVCFDFIIIERFLYKAPGSYHVL